MDVRLSHITFKDVAWPRPGGEGEAEKKMEAYISVSRQTDVAKFSNCGTASDLGRGELSYLPPLGSENIAAPYFKQCFFQGGYYPPD